MKKGICPKCGHNEVIRAVPADYGHNYVEKPMSVTADPRWIFGGRNPNYGHGRLATYTCRKCGYTEWYANRPDEIPIGEGYKTQLLRSGEP